MDKIKLKKRIDYFMSTNRRGQAEAVNFIHSVQSYGPIAIIGGMIRDLALGGNKNFNSDIDLVIKTDRLTDFQNFMKKKGAQLNKYGGYNLIIGKWKVEIWPLEKSWVRTNGLLNVNSFADMVQSTFFNWDAILYDVQNKKLITYDNYYTDLQNHLLNINFKITLNPLGNLVRTVRNIIKNDAKLDKNLAHFLYEELNKNGNDNIIYKEKNSFNKRYINENQLVEMKESLKKYVLTSSEAPFYFNYTVQKSLPLEIGS